MKLPDLDRIRSEAQITLADFLKSYNKDLPAAFPRASAATLKQFQSSHTGLFKSDKMWSLDQHRKRVMDWLPSLAPRARDVL